MIKTILVPVDGSEHARKAVLLASDIAEKYEAGLVLLHVALRGHVPAGLRHMAEIEHLVEPSAAGVPFAANIPAGTANALHEVATEGSNEALAQQIGNWVLESASKVAREKGVADIRPVLGKGDPAEEILAEAKAKGVDLIVMGSRGLSDLKGLLVGSVSHKVSQLAACTCVSVK